MAPTSQSFHEHRAYVLSRRSSSRRETLEADKNKIITNVEAKNGWIYTTTSTPPREGEEASDEDQKDRDSIKRKNRITKKGPESRNKKNKNNNDEVLEFKGSLGDGLVVGGYRELLINRAAEGLDIRLKKES